MASYLPEAAESNAIAAPLAATDVMAIRIEALGLGCDAETHAFGIAQAHAADCIVAIGNERLAEQHLALVAAVFAGP